MANNVACDMTDCKMRNQQMNHQNVNCYNFWDQSCDHHKIKAMNWDRRLQWSGGCLYSNLSCIIQKIPLPALYIRRILWGNSHFHRLMCTNYLLIYTPYMVVTFGCLFTNLHQHLAVMFIELFWYVRPKVPGQTSTEVPVRHHAFGWLSKLKDHWLTGSVFLAIDASFPAHRDKKIASQRVKDATEGQFIVPVRRWWSPTITSKYLRKSIVQHRKMHLSAIRNTSKALASCNTKRYYYNIPKSLLQYYKIFIANTTTWCSPCHSLSSFATSRSYPPWPPPGAPPAAGVAHPWWREQLPGWRKA